MADQNTLCPMCDVGHLSPITYTMRIDYHGQPLVVEGLEANQCDTCGADPVLEDQIRRNQRRITDAKREVDGLLTGDEIVAMRKDLGLSQKDAAELFGGGANAFSKYERGDVMQSVAMDRLMRVTWDNPANLDALQRLAGIVPVAPEPPALMLRAGIQRIPLDAQMCRPKHRPDNVIEVEPKVWTQGRAA